MKIFSKRCLTEPMRLKRSLRQSVIRMGLSLGCGMAAGALIPLSAQAEIMRVSWYGPGFEGNYTASGEIFDSYAHTAAHPDWPFQTLVQLTNLDTGASITVRINDRSGGALDISEQAARDLGTYHDGIAAVDVEILEWGE